jgi:hypothetical protein
MTTMEQLRAIVTDAKAKSIVLKDASMDVLVFAEMVDAAIAPSNPLSQTMDVDQIIAVFGPIWIQKLQAVEAAADALGTDNR